MKLRIFLFCACAWLLVSCKDDEQSASRITEFYPKKATAGSTIAIHGENLYSKHPIATINGVEAETTATSENLLYLKVPALATTGIITLTSNGQVQTTESLEIVPPEGTWEKKADFPGNIRNSTTCFSYNGYGYMGLGHNTGTTLKGMWRYDPSADTWTKLTSLPDEIISSLGGSVTPVATAVHEGIAYILCEVIVRITAILLYDIEADSWTAQAIDAGSGFYFNPPTGHVYNNQAYFGFYPTKDDDVKNQLPIYNFASGEISFSAAAPVEVTESRDVTWFTGSKAYSLVSQFSDNPKLLEYDLETDSWQVNSLTNFPAMINLSPAVINLNTSIYFTMGFTTYISLSDTWKYTPVTGTWTPVTPCPFIEGNPAGYFIIGNKAYFVEGQGDDNFAIPQTVMFTP